MPAVIVEGIAPWDGRYEFEDWAFSNRELYRIKEISRGLRAGELVEALDSNDTAAYVAVAIVVLERNGKRIEDSDINDFWDAKIGSLTLDLTSRNGGSPDPPTPSPSGDEPDASSSFSGDDSGSDGA